MKEVNHSPVAGFGSKYRACKECGLHLYLPEFKNRNQIYIEPFCFSAVVFFNTNSRSAILNDKDKYIYNFWKVIKTKYVELINELKYVWIGESWINEYKEREDDIGKAVFFYLVNKSVRSGMFNTEFNYKYQVMQFKKDFIYWKKRMDEMTSLTLWNLDFHELYEKIIGKGGNSREFIFYVDPPYIKQGNAYPEKMTVQDHEDLLVYHEQLKKQDNIFILISYDNCEWVKKAYKNWFMKEISFSSTTVARKANNYNELIISNKELIKQTKSKYKIKKLY